MRYVIGILLIVAGVLAGLYVGLWLMFIGGIIQVINAVKANPTPAIDVAWGVVRIIFASLVGWGIAAIGIGLGSACMGD